MTEAVIAAVSALLGAMLPYVKMWWDWRMVGKRAKNILADPEMPQTESSDAIGAALVEANGRRIKRMSQEMKPITNGTHGKS